MPFQRFLDQLTRDVEGLEGVLLLDAEGEVAFESGVQDDRQRLIGAYQGIALAAVRRAMRRHAMGGIRYLICRYEGGQVILRPLKDGYFLVLSLVPGASLAQGLRRSAQTQEQVDVAL